MRMIMLRISWLISMLIAGCMSPINADEKEPGGDEVVIVDDEEKSVAGSSVAVSMDAEQFANIARWLGHGNTLSIEKAVHVVQDNVTLDAKAGTRFSYAMGDDSGKITFETPYPTIKAGIAKLIGGVSLREVTINADGSGLAATGLGKYRFRWMSEDEDSGSATAAEKLPEVWCYGAENCPPCEKAKRDFEAGAKLLGFIPVWKTEAAPEWMPSSRPAFWWHVSSDRPTQSDVNNTRRRNGYGTLKDFLDIWHASRKPKTAASTSSPHNQLSYHASHDCPRCGREQYDIANDDGPNHTHRCESCGVSWFHADQSRASTGKSRTFFGWSY